MHRLHQESVDHMNGTTDRTKIAERAGFTGMCCNLLLFALKIVIGILANSVSIMADAFNNLSDAGSSIVSLIGSRLAGKQADEDHPFGHGRIEYIAACIVAFLVIQVGFEAFRNSVDKLLHPQELRASVSAIIVLVLSIAIKLLMALFYRKVAVRIHSNVYVAAASDSLSDVLTTSATLFSLLFYLKSGRNIDAFIGLIVSVIVIYNGFTIARDTLKPLIGQSIDPELYYTIIDFVEKSKDIYGTHDLIVHNYGPNQWMASIHAEIDGKKSMDECHEIVDRIEREARKELGVYLVIHMDPVDNNDLTIFYRAMTDKIIHELNPQVSFHDFRVHPEADEKHIVLEFDLVTPWNVKDEQEMELIGSISERLQQENPYVSCRITPDRPFMHVHSEEEEKSAREKGGEAARKAADTAADTEEKQ